MKRSCSLDHFFLVLAAMLSLAAKADAYSYTGGDWGGRDLTAADGDYFSGTFTDIGSLTIPTGATVFSGTADLAFHARSIDIFGAIDLDQWEHPSLALYAQESFSLHEGATVQAPGGDVTLLIPS